MNLACSLIRTLSGAFGAFDGKIVLCLKDLQAHWDSDRRPIINNKIINYIDAKNFTVITEDKQLVQHLHKTALQLFLEEKCQAILYVQTYV